MLIALHSLHAVCCITGYNPYGPTPPQSTSSTPYPPAPGQHTAGAAYPGMYGTGTGYGNPPYPSATNNSTPYPNPGKLIITTQHATLYHQPISYNKDF